MDWGLKNRVERIFNPKSKKIVMLAVDHGYFLGPITGLEEFSKNVLPLLPYADAIMLTRGMLRSSIPPEVRLPVVLRVSGGNSIVGEELSHEGIITSMEEAIRLNASMVALSIYVGAKYEYNTITNLAHLIDEGVKYGIPVLAVTAVGRDMKRDVRYLGLACRIAAEMGAQMVKTYYCEGFEEIIKSTPIPVVIAGGKKIEEKDAMKLAYNAIQHGACGVDMGRNIFQAKKPVSMIKAIQKIVHEGWEVDRAYKLYEEE